MAECIACKSDYTRDSPCPRCGADNGPWEKWQEDHRGLEGWMDFMAPGLYLPLFLTSLALPVGVAGTWSLWRMKHVAWPWAIPMLVVLTFICLIIMAAAYAGRNQLRERELLNRVKRGPTRFFSAGLTVLVVPIVAIVAISAWTVVILSRPSPETPEQNRLEQLLGTVESQGLLSDATKDVMFDILTLGGPLSIAALGYLSLTPALVYSSSLSLALHYADQMNQVVPLPIFLSPARLFKLVQSEAEQEWSNLGPGLVWEGVERTDEGGIKLTARYRHDRKVVEDLAGKKFDLPVHMKYEVLSDPWGRIRGITPKSELQV